MEYAMNVVEPMLWYVLAADIDAGVVTSFREDINQHRQRLVFFPERIFRVDDGMTRDRVAHNDRHRFVVHEVDDLVKQFAVFNFVFVQSGHQISPSVADDFGGQRNVVQ